MFPSQTHLRGTSVSVGLLLLACFGLHAGAQATVAPRTYFYSSWSLTGLPTNLYLGAISADAHGQTLAVYNPPGEINSHRILIAGGGYEELVIPSDLLVSQGYSSQSSSVWLLGGNERGFYVGYAPPVNRPFVWNGASLAPFTYPGAFSTAALAINVNNQVTGEYRLSAAAYPRGYVLTPGKGYRDVLAPGGRYMDSVPLAINTQGDVVGTYLNHGNESDSGAFIATADGRIFYINSSRVYDENGVLTGNVPAHVIPTGINSSGEVVGRFLAGLTWKNFYYYGGVFYVLNGPPPSNCPARPQVGNHPPNETYPALAQTWSVAGIDDHGEIYGSADCKAFSAVAPSRSGLPWYAGLASMQRTGPSAQGSTMLPGQVLQGDESVSSPSGRYTFTYQADGNLVLYRNTDHHALWASNTYLTTEGVAILQGDGNLVVYNRPNAPVFASGTSRFPGASLRVQDDGNVVIYQPNGHAVWATNTVQR